MAEKKYLPNAPITEALIDIRAKLPDDVDVHTFKVLDEPFLNKFPQQEIQNKITADFRVEKNKPLIDAKSEGVKAYIYRSEDKKNIVQFRRDGLTYNRLKPYTNWEELIFAAKELWDIYTKHSKPLTVTRIATRYINHIKLPLPLNDFSQYMTVPPKNPIKNNPISSYLNRIKIFDAEQEIGVNITQALEKGADKKSITLLLDIDAYINKNFDPTDSLIWDNFEKLRNKKNDVFFSSLTDNTINMFL